MSRVKTSIEIGQELGLSKKETCLKVLEKSRKFYKDLSDNEIMDKLLAENDKYWNKYLPGHRNCYNANLIKIYPSSILSEKTNPSFSQNLCATIFCSSTGTEILFASYSLFKN